MRPFTLIQLARAEVRDPEEAKALMQYELSATDVAELFGVSRMTVSNWVRRGRHHIRLPAARLRRDGGQYIYGFNYRDLAEFAQLTQLELDDKKLPEEVQLKMRIGIHEPATITERRYTK